jgi:hypothetical protein
MLRFYGLRNGGKNTCYMNRCVFWDFLVFDGLKKKKKKVFSKRFLAWPRLEILLDRVGDLQLPISSTQF